MAEEEVDFRVVIGTVASEGAQAGKAELERCTALLVGPDSEESARGGAFHRVFGPGFVIFPIAKEGASELDIDSVGADCGNSCLAGFKRGVYKHTGMDVVRKGGVDHLVDMAICLFPSVGSAVDDMKVSALAHLVLIVF